MAKSLSQSSGCPTVGRPPRCAALTLDPAERRQLAVRAASGKESVTELAAEHHVSRKFVAACRDKALDAVDQAFEPQTEASDVLFYLPVSKRWLAQAVLVLVLVGRCSYRAVVEIFRCLLDNYTVSIGTVHNIVSAAAESAERLNGQEELTNIVAGAEDEIFQGSKPVLAGVCIDSNYCYLLSEEQHRDEDTWGVHMLELEERGLALSLVATDGGQGLCAACASTRPNTRRQSDVFHAEADMTKLVTYLDNRATGCIAAREKLERRMARTKKQGDGRALSRRLGIVCEAERRALELADAVRTLADWLANDILSVAGPCLQDRRELLDFVVAELESREELCARRIAPMRRKLQNQADDLLVFAEVLDERLEAVALRFGASEHLVRELCELQKLDQSEALYWQRRAQLHRRSPGHLNVYDLEQAIREEIAATPRASSLVENLNSRLRRYFFLRRHLGQGYLELLRFYLNHCRFVRSRRPERQGKSAAEALLAHPHPHWLEMLGFERFRHA